MKELTKTGKCTDKECALNLIKIGTKSKICNNCREGILAQLLCYKCQFTPKPQSKKNPRKKEN